MLNYRKFSRNLLICLPLTMATAGVQAALVNRGGGLIYDTEQNITWLQDANYAKTSGYDVDGKMNWSAAMAWVENFSYYDSVRGVTYDDWRLPITAIQMEGYNQTGSELGHLFYSSLGNTAGFGDKTTNPFLNIFLPNEDWAVFYSSTHGQTSSNQGWFDYAFTFIFNDGEQDTTDPVYFERSAWAVRDGDVLAAIPEPASSVLVGLALLGLAATRTRRT